ncbi:MAG: sel1 repeat family protein [Alphaproteobacteria bacterium]|nr:sel1 repeat family protein [Alphaproteobacteria bacterium]
MTRCTQAPAGVLAVLFALHAGVAWADFGAGVRAWAKGDYAVAIKERQPLAEKGEARAQHALGQLYLAGDGVRRDPRAAADLFKRAADQGLADGQFALGQMIRDGVGMSADPHAAGGWFLKAAKQGHAGARYALGALFEQALGVTNDAGRALAWYRLAVEAGHPYAIERGNRLSLNSSAEAIRAGERHTLESLLKAGL